MDATAFRLDDLLALQSAGGQAWSEFLRVPALSMGLYTLAPGEVDPQTPHDEDEVYCVVTGRAQLQVNDVLYEVQAGSIVWVAARAPHKFVAITEQLTVLVFFAPAESIPGAG